MAKETANETRRSSGLSAKGGDESVAALQRDLAELGFSCVGAPDGIAGRMTALAVREFQIYARLNTVARELAGDPGALPPRYVDRLRQTRNGKPYRGPITGIADEPTLAAMAYWKRRRLRCPVVVEAWSMQGGHPTGERPVAENLWLKDDLTNTAPRVFVRDFSCYYDLGPGRQRDDLIVVGEYSKAGQGGPQSRPPYHTWDTCEVTPEALSGASVAATVRDPEKASTFKVVRAVSEAECRGFLDSINAWDNVYVSLGPYHWALGASTWNEGGELGGFLSYAAHAYPDAFHDAWGVFGLRADRSWGTDGRTLFSTNSRRYMCRIALSQTSDTHATVPLDADDMNLLRTWHWMYRHTMAARTITDIRRAMWDMARVRIRDLLATPWGQDLYVSGPGNERVPATIGDVFTSECAVAMIVRWHIRYPAHIVSQGVAGRELRDALLRAHGARSGKNVSEWYTEADLVDALLASPNAPATLDDVRKWPSWGSNPRQYQLDKDAFLPLSVERGSFHLDASKLPAPVSV